jgi:hypothetical protein
MSTGNHEEFDNYNVCVDSCGACPDKRQSITSYCVVYCVINSGNGGWVEMDVGRVRATNTV